MSAPAPLNSLPLFVRLAGRAVVLVGDGEAADAKRRLLERAGARIVGEDDAAAVLAIVADDDAAVDRIDQHDFTLPAIVDRDPVLIAIGTGGVSAGLAAALRQRLEGLLPASLGQLARGLYAARGGLRARFPDGAARRRAIAAALAPGGALDPLDDHGDVEVLAALTGDDGAGAVRRIVLASRDPDDLTLRHARWLAGADRVTHRADVPRAILDRARADAAREATDAPPATAESGERVVDVAMMR